MIKAEGRGSGKGRRFAFAQRSRRTTMPEDRPNIVLIVADTQRAHARSGQTSSPQDRPNSLRST